MGVPTSVGFFFLHPQHTATGISMMRFTMFYGTVCLSLFAVASANPLDSLMARGTSDWNYMELVVLMVPL